MWAHPIELVALANEPVTLAQVKEFMRYPSSVTTFDTTINMLIPAAREQGEIISNLALAKRKFQMGLDSMPYYIDTIQAQTAYPPAYYSQPRYSTTLWNYSQMMKLVYGPVWSVDFIRFVKPDGTADMLTQDVDFTLDRDSPIARIFPKPGGYWPPNLYTPNSCVVQYTAGYDKDPALAPDVKTVAVSPPNQQPDATNVLGIPSMIILGILNLITYWFNNPGCLDEVPMGIRRIFENQGVIEFAPTRG